MQAKNVHIVAVGIGQYEDFQGQLEEIGGNNIHNASNFDELSNLFDEILAETCSEYPNSRTGPIRIDNIRDIERHDRKARPFSEAGLNLT